MAQVNFTIHKVEALTDPWWPLYHDFIQASQDALNALDVDVQARLNEAGGLTVDLVGNNNQATGFADGTAPTHLVTKQQLDAAGSTGDPSGVDMTALHQAKTHLFYFGSL